MKELLLNGWSIMRTIRLVLGVMLIVQAVQASSVAIGLLGGLLLLQGITNTGCCGTSGCAFPQKNDPPKKETVLTPKDDL